MKYNLLQLPECANLIEKERERERKRESMKYEKIRKTKKRKTNVDTRGNVFPLSPVTSPHPPERSKWHDPKFKFGHSKTHRRIKIPLLPH
jgi:hypothetical protein